MEAFFESDWRSGEAVLTWINSGSAEPLGIAGLWSSWKSPKGLVHSSTILTINADGHELMCRLHKPVGEKRMVVILPTDSYGAWLQAKPQYSMDFMRVYAGQLVAEAEQPAQVSFLD